MKEPTKFVKFVDRAESPIEMYVSSIIAGNINLTIKEELIMLEDCLNELISQRDEFVAELEAVKNIDLDVIKNERFELIKEQIAKQVEDEHNQRIADIELDISNYNYVIEKQRAKAEAIQNEQIENEQVENEQVEVSEQMED